jgi:hypothetical protein
VLQPNCLTFCVYYERYDGFYLSVGPAEYKDLGDGFSTTITSTDMPHYRCRVAAAKRDNVKKQNAILDDSITSRSGITKLP